MVSRKINLSGSSSLFHVPVGGMARSTRTTMCNAATGETLNKSFARDTLLSHWEVDHREARRLQNAPAACQRKPHALFCVQPFSSPVKTLSGAYQYTAASAQR
jgi:hypothetical protein